MTIRSWMTFGSAWFAALFAPVPLAAESSREIHGMDDGYSAPGVALAWGILRAANEAETKVVLRVVVDPRNFETVGAVGKDPFTQATKALPLSNSGPGTFDLLMPRAHFSEFPRTELRFYGVDVEIPSDAPKLVVYYVGVPDTTPEFQSEHALGIYLNQRIRQLNDSSGPKSP